MSKMECRMCGQPARAKYKYVFCCDNCEQQGQHRFVLPKGGKRRRWIPLDCPLPSPPPPMEPPTPQVESAVKAQPQLTARQTQSKPNDEYEPYIIKSDGPPEMGPLPRITKEMERQLAPQIKLIREMIKHDTKHTSEPEESAEATHHNGRLKNDGTDPLRPNPITTEIEYDADELEFLKAIDSYKTRTGRKFPTWSEALAILRSLGYVKSRSESGAIEQSAQVLTTGLAAPHPAITKPEDQS